MSLIWLHILFLLNPPKVEVDVEVIERIPVFITVTVRDGDIEGRIKAIYPLVEVLPVKEFKRRFGEFTPQDLFELRWHQYIKEEVTLVDYLF